MHTSGRPSLSYIIAKHRKSTRSSASKPRRALDLVLIEIDNASVSPFSLGRVLLSSRQISFLSTPATFYPFRIH